MTCHLGYTLQQAAFAFLYLVAPIGLAARHCAPLDLLGVSAACSIAAGIYHAGLAVVCESPWASETVHGYWDVDSFARLRMACVARIIVSLTWSVSPYIIHGKDAFKAVMSASKKELSRHRLYLQFDREEGLDYGKFTNLPLAKRNGMSA